MFLIALFSYKLARIRFPSINLSDFNFAPVDHEYIMNYVMNTFLQTFVWDGQFFFMVLYFHVF